MNQKWPAATIFTVGHSTHPIGEFIAMLEAYNVRTLVDIRTVPRSRHNPQFSREVLAAALEASGVAYRSVKELGGLRRPGKDSPNLGWRNLSFRGYADYMQTAEFKDAVEELVAIGTSSRTAIMCAEAVPWRCHRSLVADALLVRGVHVIDIMSATNASPHVLTSFALVNGKDIVYPAVSRNATEEQDRRTGDLFG